jgi:phospholipid/cholesterol/gamma-HCH transport system permease protein
MIRALGFSIRQKASQAAYTVGFFGKTLRGVPPFFYRGQTAWNILVMQILFTFVEALTISAVLAVGIGASVILLGTPLLESLSQTNLIYPILILIVTRELGPLLTAFIVVARSATAIATEIAGMVVSHEIEAYISVGVDPIEHIAVPRFIGVTVSVFLLNAYFSLFGLAGSFLVSQMFSQISARDYFGHLLESLTVGDLAVSLAKSVAFGVIIATGAITQGFSVERASTEVPQAGLRAVGSAFAACIFADLVISALYYMVT